MAVLSKHKINAEKGIALENEKANAGMKVLSVPWIHGNHGEVQRRKDVAEIGVSWRDASTQEWMVYSVV